VALAEKTASGSSARG